MRSNAISVILNGNILEEGLSPLYAFYWLRMSFHYITN